MSDRDEAPEGFTAYVAARRAALVRSAYLLVGSLDDAEDLVQVALVKTVPHWHRIADHPEPYVRRILVRESVSRWRRRRWREVSTGVLPERPVVAADADDAAVLREALTALAPRQRAVIVLRYFEDLTERQTADVLGISVGTVKSQARDGLARLRALLPVVDHVPAQAERAPSPRTGASVKPPRRREVRSS